MQSWWSYLAVLACVAGVRGTWAYSLESGCPRPDQECVSIRACAEYQTSEDVLRHRPEPCAFSGLTPLVCCSAAEPSVTSAAEPSVTSAAEPSVTSAAEPSVTSTAEGPVTSAPQTVPRSSLLDLLLDQCGQPRNETGFYRGQEPLDRGDAEQRLEDIHAVGGVDAQLGKWPWMVLFGRWTDDGLRNWFCGGVLITDRHVLTAAHCMRPEETIRFGARVGDNDLRIGYEVDDQERLVIDIARHPQYRGSQNDLAVVRLATPVKLTEAVRPICMPPAGAEHIGQDVEVAGWGRLEFGGETSNVLQEVALRVTDPAACEAAYRRLPQFETRFPGGFQGTKVCAGSRDGEPRDACKGDSGGPLMVQLGDGSYQLVGIVSGGFGCGNPDFPGVYSKVSAYIDWIVSQVVNI